MIIAYQGDTPTIEFETKDESGALLDLTGCKVEFFYSQRNGLPVHKTPVINGSLVSASFLSTETALMEGIYRVTLRIEDTHLKLNTLYVDLLRVLPNPDAIIE